jgi:hypothetical protein
METRTCPWDPQNKDFKNGKEKKSLQETSAVLESEIEEEERIHISIQQGIKKTQQIKTFRYLYQTICVN